MELEYLTLIHVIISLVGIASGFGVLAGLLAATLFPRWTALFLATTVATSVTGFFFPFRGFTPAFAVGSFRSWCWRWRSTRSTPVASPAHGARLSLSMP